MTFPTLGPAGAWPIPVPPLSGPRGAPPVAARPGPPETGASSRRDHWSDDL